MRPPPTASLKRVQRAIGVYGYRGAASRAVGIIRTAGQRHEPDPFDAEHGTDTDGVVRLERLSIRGPNGRYGVRYQPSETEATAAALRTLPIDYEHFTFIDVGSGKGRVLLIAAELPFRRLLGVEFAEELCRVAERNVENAGLEQRIQIVCGDAAAYEFPPDPLVLYFYNPFLVPVMRRVMESVTDSLRQLPRQAYVLLAGEHALAPELTAAGFAPVPSAGGLLAWRWPD